MLKGSIIAQILGVIGTIFLAKLYGPNAFGLFGIFYSTTRIISILYTLQLEKGIVISTTKIKAVQIFNISIILSIIICCVSLILISTLNHAYEINNYKVILLSAIGALFIAINTVNESFFTFDKKFKILASTKILLTLMNILFQFIFYLKFKFFGLIYGALFSLGFVLIYYLILNSKKLSFVSIKSIKSEIIVQNSIVKYLLPSNLINSSSIHIMPIAMAFFFSLEDVGIYFFSLKILSIPLFLISSSISSVYFQKASAMFNHKKYLLYDFSKRIVFLNLLTTIIILLFINTIGIDLLEYFFTKDWDKLRSFMLIISFLIICKSLFNPISNIIIVLNKNQIGLIFNIYLLIISCLAIFVGAIYDNIIYSIYTLTIFSGVGYIVLLLIFMNKLNRLKSEKK